MPSPVPTPRRRSSGTHRAGFLMFAVLAMVLVVFLIVVGLFRQLSVGLQQSRLRQRQLQSVWLAESGIERAVAKWRADPNYSGETWQISQHEFATVGNANDTGVVTISVEADGEALGHVQVTAEFPATSVHRVRTVHRVTVTPLSAGVTP